MPVRNDYIYMCFSSDMQRKDSCEDQDRNVRGRLQNHQVDPHCFKCYRARTQPPERGQRSQKHQTWLAPLYGSSHSGEQKGHWRLDLGADHDPETFFRQDEAGAGQTR